MYIGDTRGDRLAAEAAGWPFVFARYGFGDASSDCIAVERFGELTEALLTAAGESGRP